IARESREIVRADADCGLAPVIAGRLEVAIARPFEIEKIAAEHVHGRHPLAEAFGHGAQIFAEDEALVAQALERENSCELGEGKTDGAAVLRLSAKRHQELPL